MKSQNNTPLDNKGKKVLLVDDDPLINRMYQKKLSQDGYQVDVTRNGEEALAHAKKNKPDIILLDLMMPKMGGVETLKLLKKDSQLKKVPVLILTNLEDQSGDKKKAKKLGAVDYLVKSEISLQELSDVVKKTI